MKGKHGRGGKVRGDRSWRGKIPRGPRDEVMSEANGIGEGVTYNARSGEEWERGDRG